MMNDDLNAEIQKDIEVIRQISNLAVVQMNLDWIEQQLQGKTPIAIGMVLGEFQLLFEEVKAKLLAESSEES